MCLSRDSENSDGTACTGKNALIQPLHKKKNPLDPVAAETTRLETNLKVHSYSVFDAKHGKEKAMVIHTSVANMSHTKIVTVKKLLDNE